MLRFRVITALALAPVVLWLVWFAPRALLLPAFGAVSLLAAWEWAMLMTLSSTAVRLVYVALVAAVLGLAWLYLEVGWTPTPVLLLALAWWLAAVCWLQRFSGNPASPPPTLWLAGVVGLAVLAPAWFAIVYLLGLPDRSGPYWITVLFVLVWGSDVGAYFTGKSLGRRKLAPRISPGKTWEGVAGGLAAGVGGTMAVHAVGVALGFAPSGPQWYVLLPVAAVTVGFAVAGDLFESMMKRQRGVKDSGSMLPGHGGILDRIDALVAAAPVLALGLHGSS